MFHYLQKSRIERYQEFQKIIPENKFRFETSYLISKSKGINLLRSNRTNKPKNLIKEHCFIEIIYCFANLNYDIWGILFINFFIFLSLYFCV